MAEASFDYDWYNGHARIGHIIHIEGAICQGEDSLPDVFKDDFCEELPERKDAPLYSQCPALAEFADTEDDAYPDEIAFALISKRVRGFFIHAEQPVATKFYDDTSFSFSWGYYHTEWLYAPDMAGIEQVVSEWSKDTLDRDRAKFASSKEQAA